MFDAAADYAHAMRRYDAILPRVMMPRRADI